MTQFIQQTVEEAQDDPTLNKFIHFTVPDRIEHLVKLTANLGGLPAFSGNSIELLPHYDDNFIQITNDISQATRFVHIEFFIIVLDKSTTPLFDAMAEAVKRGVVVRVLFDSFSSRRYPDYKKMKQTLTDIGVEWYAMLPLKLPGANFNRPDLRNHRKLAIIDGVIGYTGS